MARRIPNLVITIPPGSAIPKRSSGWGISNRLLLNIFPWVVCTTIILWLFILRTDQPPLRVYSPQPHSPIDGFRPRPLHPPHRQQPTTVTTWAERAEKVRQSFIHAYTGYSTHAGGHDELLPVTGGSTNKWADLSSKQNTLAYFMHP
jgi:mannosyl-oligosaccharide alpha-1,2-mannosidase